MKPRLFPMPKKRRDWTKIFPLTAQKQNGVGSPPLRKRRDKRIRPVVRDFVIECWPVMTLGKKTTEDFRLEREGEIRWKPLTF